MDPTIEWNSVKFELEKDWLKGEFSCRSKPVDGKMPSETNFFLVFYDSGTSLPAWKAYTVDQGVAERCCSKAFPDMRVHAYQIPEERTLENNFESDFDKIMSKCRETKWHDALGDWLEEHKMSNHLYDQLADNVKSEEDDIKEALNSGLAEDVTGRPESPHFWVGQYSPEFWDESERRKRSGKGVTTEREIADEIFTINKRAFRMRRRFSHGHNLMDRINDNPHWFGRTEFIWKWPVEDPEADLILFMRSDNVQRELKRLGLEGRFPLPEKREKRFKWNTHFTHQREVQEAKRTRGA